MMMKMNDEIVMIIILQIEIILLLTCRSHLNLIDKGYPNNVSMDIENSINRFSMSTRLISFNMFEVISCIRCTKLE